jgi:hypothetical protein
MELIALIAACGVVAVIFFAILKILLGSLEFLWKNAFTILFFLVLVLLFT